ncbi:NAD(P)-dependent oxidoreductase [Devosia sp. A16]|uniref:NAD(P)-dependent oxidoreductase n=1 Tax=Devosia sp. A16 TaxID=1736675 RepID=UPI0006D8309D|nr:NAD(P)-binding oxidoreductase [Devosia sp. A16]
MRIIVIGGSGRTGILIVEQLVAAGHSVVATIRNPRHMAETVKRGAETIVLDLEKSPLAEFTATMQGADAVVFAAGSAAGEGSALDRIGTRRTVHAAENAGVRRYVAISALGASTGLSTRSLDDEMKDYYRQKRAAAKFIHASSLGWTILEPGELTDGGGTGKVLLSLAAINEESVPRADVAAVVVALLEEPRSIGKALQLTRGTHSIAAALKAALG